jgi:NADH-quinone oxidoreductase subunit H
LIIVPILIAVAYFTLVERKVLGSIQRRRGPNVIGFFGLLQPLSDGFKLLVKEVLLPSSSNKILFIVAPFITFVLSLIN